MAIYEKYNDEAMKRWYSKFLMPGENIEAAAYGMYANTGSFLSNGAFPGYLALTSNNRIICHNNDITGGNDYYYDLADMIKIKRGFWGNLVIFIVFSNGRKKAKLKFNTPKKLRGNHFCNHEGNVNILESRLSALMESHRIESNPITEVNEMREIFEEIMRLGGILEAHGVDFVKCEAPIAKSEINDWEKTNNITLPAEYKQLILLANGLHYGMTSIYSLNQIRKDKYQFDGYYAIGDYIGDGSLILCNEIGNIFSGDHEFGIKQIDLKDFLNEWIIRTMQDDLKDNDIG